MDPEYRERLERDAELDRLRVENAELKRKLERYEGRNQLAQMECLQRAMMYAPSLSELMNQQNAQSYRSPLENVGYGNAIGGLIPAWLR